jgi:hypothetical protein
MVAYAGHRVLSDVIVSTGTMEAMHELVNGILQARMSEKDFMLAGETAVARQVNEHIQRLDTRIQAMQSGLQQEQMEGIHGALTEYQTTFASYTEMEQQRRDMIETMKEKAVNALHNIEGIRDAQLRQLDEIERQTQAFVDETAAKARHAKDLIGAILDGEILRYRMMKAYDTELKDRWEANNEAVFNTIVTMQGLFTAQDDLATIEQAMLSQLSYVDAFQNYLRKKGFDDAYSC